VLETVNELISDLLAGNEPTAKQSADGPAAGDTADAGGPSSATRDASTAPAAPVQATEPKVDDAPVEMDTMSFTGSTVEEPPQAPPPAPPEPPKCHNGRGRPATVLEWEGHEGEWTAMTLARKIGVTDTAIRTAIAKQKSEGDAWAACRGNRFREAAPRQCPIGEARPRHSRSESMPLNPYRIGG
jgi:hypothetical protein